MEVGRYMLDIAQKQKDLALKAEIIAGKRSYD